MQGLWILVIAPVNDIILALGIQEAGFLYEQIGKKLKVIFLLNLTLSFDFEAGNWKWDKTWKFKKLIYIYLWK